VFGGLDPWLCVLQTINKLLAPEVRALGVVAAFRDLERARWRAAATLVPGKDNVATVSVEDLAVRVKAMAR
jgi:type VI secretion system protein VasD